MTGWLIALVAALVVVMILRERKIKTLQVNIKEMELRVEMERRLPDAG